MNQYCQKVKLAEFKKCLPSQQIFLNLKAVSHIFTLAIPGKPRTSNTASLLCMESLADECAQNGLWGVGRRISKNLCLSPYYWQRN